MISPAITRHGFWLAAFLPLLMPLSWLVRGNPLFEVWWSWLPLLILFVVLPLIDHLLGRYPVNLELGDRKPTEANPYPDTTVPFCATLIYLAVFAWAMWLASTQWQSWSWPILIGWVLSLGNLGGVVAINVAHEWIHRRARWQRMLGGLLLSCVLYPGFKLEHLRWHHVKVATPEDPSSAPYGSTIYQQAPRAMWLNTIRGWKLSVAAAEQKGRAIPWLQHEVAGWWLLSAALALVFTAYGGVAALTMFAAQGVVAVNLLEVINYVEHYGLRRTRMEDGRYEPPTVAHSWNADHWLSNAVLINLQRHSDHHIHPTRPFTHLQTMPEAPLLPMSYSALSLLVYFPPLWRKLIHPHLPPQAG